MDKQMIEEMTTSLLGAYNQARQFDGYVALDTIKDMAKYLINKYQPKIPEGAVVVSKQVWEEHIENFDKCREAIEERVCKETAEKFAEMAKELLDKQERGWSANMIWIITAKNCIDETCKKITEGKV